MKHPESWCGDERGMSDSAVKDEREAIAAVKKAFAVFRSELQDARAKITTLGNRLEIDEILDGLKNGYEPDYDEMEETLQSERNE